MRALDYLRKGGQSEVLNCGYGHGYSVREVLDMVEKISGNKLNIREEPRRAGDPSSLVASSDKAKDLLGWEPKYDDLEVIVKTALEWEKN